MTETPQTQGVRTAHLHDYRQLRRSVSDRKVAGVAGGLGRHLNIDPTIIRVALVVLCLFGGAGLVLYSAAWLLVPEEGKEHAVISIHPGTRNTLLLVAAVIAASLVVGNSWHGFGFRWPLAIIALIAFVILMNRDRRMNTPAPPSETNPQPRGPEPTAAEADTAESSGPEADPAESTTMTIPTAYDDVPPAPPWTPPTQQAYQPPRPKPQRGPLLFGITLALIAVALGSLGLYDVAGGHVAAAAYPALATAVIGAMLVVGAWVGRAGGLILLGLMSSLAVAAASIGNPGFHGDRALDIHPASATSVKSTYSVPAGRIRLDLSKVQNPAQLNGRTIDLHANAGELVVVLPRDVSANVAADISGAGNAQILQRESDGLGIHMTGRVPSTSADQSAHVNLNLDLVVGHIEVRQP